MSGPRLAASVAVSALIRQAASEGGSAMLLAKGDATAGALLVILADRGVPIACRERGLLPRGEQGWIHTGPTDLADPLALAAYLEKRRRFDSDLWVVEIDGLAPDRLDEMLAGFA